jgi:CxxC motif-containing protein (DUF1111 family)
MSKRFQQVIVMTATLASVIAAVSAKPEHRTWKVASATVRTSPVVDTSAATAHDGKELFAREWIPNDPRSPGGDGLGPMYNDTSCIKCHNQGGAGGAGPRDKNVRIVTPLSGTTPNGPGRCPTGPSFVLHRFSTEPGFEAWVEREVLSPDESVRKGLDLFGPGKVVTERNPTALFGAGQIDAINERMIEKGAGKKFDGYPEIVGRVARGPDGKVGRFGWKAQVGHLDEFVLMACSVEVGLQVPEKDQSPLPHRPTYKAPGLDLSADDCAALVDYVRRLPAPIQQKPLPNGPAEYLEAGYKNFVAVGCATCHTPRLGDVDGIYSDLLLHDMGPTLSDPGSSYGGASLTAFRQSAAAGGKEIKARPSEWRTPPLWGVRDSAPYLHDGRADTLESAINMHFGQAQRSREQFGKLAPADRLQVLAFLKSLVAPRDP